VTNKEKTSVKYIALPASLPSGLNNGGVIILADLSRYSADLCYAPLWSLNEDFNG